MKKLISLRLILLLLSLAGSLAAFCPLFAVPVAPALLQILQGFCAAAFFLKLAVLIYLIVAFKRKSEGFLPAALMLMGALLADLPLAIFLFSAASAPVLPWLLLGLALIDLILLGLVLGRALRRSGSSPRPWLYAGLLLLLLLVFGGFFAAGFVGWDPSSGESASEITGFTADDERLILQNIQADFSESIYYQTSAVSDLIENDEGVCFYDVTYLVCVPSSDQVYLYLYYKFVSDSPDYKAGDVVCMMTSVSPSLTKADLFPNGLT